MQDACFTYYIWIIHSYIDDVSVVYWLTDTVTFRMGVIGYIFFWKLEKIKNRTHTSEWII